MRTFAQTSGIQNVIRNLFHTKDSHSHHVEGRLAFVFAHHLAETSLQLLREAILAVDSEFPWKDFNYYGDPYPSIRMLSDGEALIHNYTTPEKWCWFSIFPGHQSLKRSQVYAYEKYLMKLAEELAKRRLPNVAQVRNVMQVTTGSTFTVE